ncbi:MAG: hypothetical protein HZB38_00825 [Planctomycetes bacterium]|nr:hypothetical protein [Planctomycetota bacterium]
MRNSEPAGPPDRKRPACRDSLALFLLLYFVYAATSSGDLMADSEIRWATARSLVEHGWFDIPAEFTPQHAVGLDGKAYSFYAPGQALLLAPFAAAGRAIAALNLPIGGGGDMFGQFLASVVLFPLCGAAAMVVLLWVVRDLTGSAPLARAVALLCGLTTMHWHHTISGGDESQVALCVLVALWAMQRAWLSGSWPLRWLCMAAMGLAVCFRPSAAIICVPLGLVGFAFDMI